MKKNLPATALLGALACANAGASSLTIEGPSSATLGESFQLQIWGEFGDTGLFAGGVGFAWDDAKVRLDGITLELPVDPTFSCPGSAGCINALADGIPITWGSFDEALIDLSDPSPVLMATLDFSAIGVASATSFSMFDINDFTGGWFDASFDPMADPDLGSLAMEVVVPLPAAAWLMLSGLGALLVGARKPS